jgi:tetratricopeptide (TPR) repeat protein
VARTVGEQIGLLRDRESPATPAAIAARPPRQPTRDLVAYNYYIQGRQCLERGESPQSWAKAREYFEAAVAHDAEFALAHDALAELHWNTGFFALVPPRQALASGMPHALRAVEIDDRLAEAHAMLAQYRKQLEFDWDEVAREMARALELNPASPIVRRRHAITGLMPFGRLDDAIRDLEVALDLDPLGLFSRLWLVVMLQLDRQYDRGIAQGRLLLEIEPRHFIAHLTMGCVCREAGIFHEAIPALRKAAELTGGNPVVLGWLGLSLAESGDASGARALLARLRALPSHVYVPPTSFAWIHVGLGEIDEFFEAMTRAIDARDHMITPIKSYPFLDAVRGDRRYGDLLRKMNLA